MAKNKKLNKRIKKAAKDGRITKKELKKITKSSPKASPKKIQKAVKKTEAEAPKKVLKTIKKAAPKPTKKESKVSDLKKENKKLTKKTEKLKTKQDRIKKNLEIEKNKPPEIRLSTIKKEQDTKKKVTEAAKKGKWRPGGGSLLNERESGVSGPTPEQREEQIETLEQDIVDLENDLNDANAKKDRYKYLAESLKKINKFGLSDAVNFRPNYRTNKGGMKDAITLVKQNAEKLYEERSKRKPPPRIGDYKQNTTKELKQRIKEISGKDPMKFFKEKNMRFEGGTIGKNQTLRINKKGELVKRDLSNDPYGFEAMSRAEEKYSTMGTKLQSKYDNAMSYIQKDPTKQETKARGILSNIKEFGKPAGRTKQARIDLGIKSES